MKKYRVAIIGLGRMGSTIDDEKHPSVVPPYSIAATCRASERLELAAGCDLLPEKREAFKKRWGVSAVYHDYMEMVEREKPDLVAICTRATSLQKPGDRAPSPRFRSDLHAELTASLADAGVPMLYVEKAMACSMAAADKALEACRRNRTVVNTGVLRRFHATYHAMRAIIQRGDIGEPAAVVPYTAASLMHGHIHSIDAISFLLGDPGIQAVRGELQPRELKVQGNRLDEDPRATYHIVFKGGVEAWAVPAGTLDVEVVGTEGSIRALNNGAGMSMRTAAGGQRGEWHDATVPQVERGSTVVACLEDLVDACESGRPALANVEQSHHMTEACLAVADSHRRGGGWVPLPMENRDLYVFHV